MFPIVSCLGLLIAAIVSVYAVQLSRSTETEYAIQLTDSTLFPISLNIDIEVLDRRCDGSNWMTITNEELTFHFNPTKSRTPEAIDVATMPLLLCRFIRPMKVPTAASVDLPRFST